MITTDLKLICLFFFLMACYVSTQEIGWAKPVSQKNKSLKEQTMSIDYPTANSPLPLGDLAGSLKPNFEVATLAGGCFWGMEEIIRGIKGVVDTQVGYTGGKLENPTYKEVKTGTTGHAEAIQVVYDPKKLSYEDLLLLFFRMHDPTTANRQGNDIGTQYRSAIFVYSAEQQKVAEAVKKQIDESKKWKNPIVTEIVKAARFWQAETYHQKYLEKNPGGYTCHFLRD